MLSFLTPAYGRVYNSMLLYARIVCDFIMDSELLNCRKLLKIDVGKYVIPELGQLCKQISVFHEIDIESQKENGCG